LGRPGEVIMDLILWRHAEAEREADNIVDSKRRLTPAGQQQAADMAGWLKKRLPKRTQIYASPTVRTVQTADYLELPYVIEKKIAVGADAVDLLAVAKWPEERGAVLLIGHQPAIGRLASILLGGEEMDIPIKKAGLWWFSTRVREHRMQVVLRAVMNPDLV
jgi:phosphohistidine phosphatase